MEVVAQLVNKTGILNFFGDLPQFFVIRYLLVPQYGCRYNLPLGDLNASSFGKILHWIYCWCCILALLLFHRAVLLSHNDPNAGKRTALRGALRRLPL